MQLAGHTGAQSADPSVTLRSAACLANYFLNHVDTQLQGFLNPCLAVRTATLRPEYCKQRMQLAGNTGAQSADPSVTLRSAACCANYSCAQTTARLQSKT